MICRFDIGYLNVFVLFGFNAITYLTSLRMTSCSSRCGNKVYNIHHRSHLLSRSNRTRDMRGLQMDSPLRLALVFVAVCCSVHALDPRPTLINAPLPNQQEPGQGQMTPLSALQPITILFQQLIKMRPTLEGNSAGVPKKFLNSPCLNSPKARKEFFDDLKDAFMSSDETTESNDDDDDDVTTASLVNNEKEEANMDSTNMMDIDDIFDKISEKSLSCIENLMDNSSAKMLCKSISSSPSNIKIFKKLVAAGSQCVRLLREIKSENNDGDDDDDMDFDEAQQSVIFDGLRRRKNLTDWDDEDVDEILDAAPDFFDEDIVNGLSDDIFSKSIQKIGQIIKKGKGSPGLATALVNRFKKNKPLEQMTAEDINNIGDGLLALDVDDIDELDSLEDADLDLDVGDNRPLGIAIARKLREKNSNPRSLNATAVRKMFKFVKSDVNFMRNINVDALVDSLDDINDDDMDDAEAFLACEKIRESSTFSDPSNITGAEIRKLGKILKGCGKDFFDDIPPQALQTAMMYIKNLDFDSSTAREILKKLQLGKPSEFNAGTLRNLSGLAMALNDEEIAQIDDDVIAEVIDIFDDDDLDDSVAGTILEKAKRAKGGKLPVDLLKNKAFREKISLDDVDDMDVSELSGKLTELSTSSIKPTVASLIVKKLMKRNNEGSNQKYVSRELETLGKLIVGLSEDDIENIADDKEEIMNSAAMFGKVYDDLRDGQSETIAKKIKKVMGNGEFNMDEIDASRISKFVPNMEDEDIDRIKFSSKGAKAFMNVVNKKATTKVPRKKLQYMFKLAKKLLMAEKQSGDDTITEDDLKGMVGTLAGITPDEIRGLGNEALLGNLEAFSKIPLTQEQGKALIEMVEKIDDNYKCKSDRMAQIGDNLRFLSEDKLDALCKDQLSAAASSIINDMEIVMKEKKERRNNGLGGEEDNDGDDDDRFRKLSVAVSTSLRVRAARKRRSANGLTCDQVKIMGSRAVDIPAADYDTMTNADFSNCLDTLGELGGWSPDHLGVLVRLAKKVLYGHVSWTPDTISRVGSIVAGLTADEIQQLNLNTTSAMFNTAKHGLLTKEKLMAGFSRWLSINKNGAADQITGAELSSLSEYVCGADLPQIQALNVEAFKQSIRPIGNAQSCRHDQLQEYAKKAVAAYGQTTNTWDAPVVNDLGRTIGGLTSSQIASLTTSHIKVLRPEIIPRLPSDALAAMSVEQMQQFSTNQANSVTKAQFQALTASKQSAIKAKATISHDDSGSGDHGGAGHLSPISFLAVMLLAVLPSYLM